MASKDSSTFYPVLDIGQGLDIPDFSKIPKKDWKKVVDDLNKKQAEKYILNNFDNTDHLFIEKFINIKK